MKVSDVMARRPLVVDPATPPHELAELMETARIRHLPLLDGESLVGLWVATESGPLVLLGPERVHEADAESEAAEAMRALLAGHEAVLVREGGKAVGLLTQHDALNLVDRALEHGLGRRTTHPVVLRLVGGPRSGKSTLLMRTIPLLRTCEVGIVRAEHVLQTREDAQGQLEGAPIVVEPQADHDAPLARAIGHLGDVQVVFVEDRDELPSGARRLPCDYLVVVAPADEADGLAPDLLAIADAVVVTKLDIAPRSFDLALTRDGFKRAAPHIEVFGVAAAADDRGLDVWRRWLRGRALPRQH